MVRYVGEPQWEHGTLPAVGILLVNLGTPEQPTTRGLRRYLREFLWDPRVIELPRLQWWLILNLFVLTTRPRTSAALYRKIWTPEGSPLLRTCRRQADAIEQSLKTTFGNPLYLALGMRYGHPAVGEALAELRAMGCRRLLVLPLYPQYSATTTGSSFDAVARELTRWRWVPELRTIHYYYDDPAYISALASSIKEAWNDGGRPDKLLFSFHGVPQRYFDSGDPYFCHCQKTARLVAEELALDDALWEVAFQSRFGREEWIKPYTDQTVAAMARAGIRHLDVVCPGFSADCLETLDEIDGLNRGLFLDAGGEEFRYIPALNDRSDHIRVLLQLLERNLQGWMIPAREWNEKGELAQGEASNRRAESVRSQPPPPDAGYG
jgi:ferrochelatase